MRLLKKDRSGVSEVVGAILLVLIVVIAASSFAIFISQYQESQQAQKLDDQKRTQEKIKVTSIMPKNGTDNDDNKWIALNFTIASLHNERSEITRIAINDNMVWSYQVWRVSPYTGLLEGKNYTTKDTVNLAPRDEITVHVDIPLSLYTPSVSLLTSSYVKIDITTGWQNSFSKTFAPPSAVATHSPGSWTNTSNSSKPVQEYYATLNGRSSVAYDGAYIVSWNWTVVSVFTNETGVSTWNNSTVTGSVCRVDFPLKGAWNVVTLTVKDNFGMIGSSTIKFYN